MSPELPVPGIVAFLSFFKMHYDTLKSFFSKLLLVILSIILALIIFESLTRLFFLIKDINPRLYTKELKNSDRLPSELFSTHKTLKTILNPNVQVLATTSDFSVFYNTNSRGLRDKEYTYKKPKNKIRILAFGDSFAFGEGVKYGKRFTDIPEKKLSNIEIINFGVPGYGIDQELLLFYSEGIKYTPDFIILFINKASIERYCTNIIKDGEVRLKDTNFYNIAKSGNTLYLNKSHNLFKNKNNFFLNHSYLISYLNYRMTLFKLKKSLQKYDKNLWNNIYSNMSRQYDNLTEKTIKKQIKRRTKLIIKKFNQIAKINNIKFIVMKIDIHNDLDLSFLKKIDDNIIYYDLTNSLKKESKKYPLTFKYDPHYNSKTHQFIAKKLNKILSGLINQK